MVNRGGGEEAEGRLVFAYYITGHGFGHATRAIEVPPRPFPPHSSSCNLDQHDLN